MPKSKASPKENVNTDTKLVDAYNKGQSIQSIADEHDMTSAEVEAVVVK